MSKLTKDLLDTSVDVQLKQVGIVIGLFQAKHGMSDRELCLRSQITLGTLKRIKAGTYMGYVSAFTKIASVFDVGFEVRFDSWSSLLPASFSEELAQGEKP